MRLISAPSTANDALNQARLSDKLQPFRYLPGARQQLEDANKRNLKCWIPNLNECGFLLQYFSTSRIR
jgi:hypothetical protein